MTDDVYSRLDAAERKLFRAHAPKETLAHYQKRRSEAISDLKKIIREVKQQRDAVKDQERIVNSFRPLIKLWLNYKHLINDVVGGMVVDGQKIAYDCFVVGAWDKWDEATYRFMAAEDRQKLRNK